jgi:hypothetical protein
MKNFLLALFLLLPLQSFAAGKTACVCQIGLDPFYQRGIFRMGCDRWLREQPNCDFSVIQDLSTEKGPLALDASVTRGTLRLGYVGHWANTIESYNYFQQTVAPTMNKYKVAVAWDNTACSGLAKPESFLELLNIEKDYSLRMQEIDRQSNKNREIIAQMTKGRYTPTPVREIPFWMTAPLIYRANQTRSVGLWDRYIMASSSNLWAMVNVKQNKITFPTCEAFLSQPCTAPYQLKETGRCRIPSGRLKSIVCCEKPDASFGNDQTSTYQGASWVEGTKCR